MEKQFTAEMAKIMTPEEILQFWIDRQQADKERGEFYYRELVDPITDKVIAEIEE